MTHSKIVKEVFSKFENLNIKVGSLVYLSVLTPKMNKRI